MTILPSDKGFTSSRCATWTPLGPAVTKNPTEPFADGTYVVGLDIAPGTWRTAGQSGCYWARLKDLTGDMGSLLANENSPGSAVVAIAATDKGFTSRRCGTWTKAA